MDILKVVFIVFGLLALSICGMVIGMIVGAIWVPLRILDGKAISSISDIIPVPSDKI
jgi:hypothetical protein